MGGWLAPVYKGVRLDLVGDLEYRNVLYAAYKACKHNKLKFPNKWKTTTPAFMFNYDGEVPGLQGHGVFNRVTDPKYLAHLFY